MMFGDQINMNQFFRRDDDTFTFENPNPIPLILGILASNWVAQIPPVGLINLPSPANITNPAEFSDYQQLVNDKEMTPKNIKGIRLTFGSANVNQIARPFNWSKRNANGKVRSFVDYPLNLVPLDQFQDQLVDIYYDNLIIGLDEFLVYELLPFENVTMTFTYDDFRLENLLNKKERRVIYSRAELDRFEYLL
jgi:hypothetical protein